MNPVLEWISATDVALEWQVKRDLLHRPESEWKPVRARIETEGWGKELLSHQDADGQWAGGSFAPSDATAAEFKENRQPWSATAFVLDELRELGLDPNSAIAQKTVKLVGDNSKWDEGGQRFWDGETEECINGRAVTSGSYFGANVDGIVKRLLGEVQSDGGWNCDRPKGSIKSSYDTTINVLEGLLAYEAASGATDATTAARKSGEEFLLTRSLYKRLSTGEAADKAFLQLIYPWRYAYDILRALEYFRAASLQSGEKPDPRLGEAVGILRSKKTADGKWNLERDFKGRRWLEVNPGGVGAPSAWITLRALRVLAWWDENQ